MKIPKAPELKLDIIQKEIEKIKSDSSLNNDLLTELFNCIDLTSLGTEDNEAKIVSMIEKVNNFSSNFDINNVAAVCVYPNFAETVKNTLENKNIGIAVVSAGFPSSQTFLSVKLAESELAVSKGANEVDIVISLGKFISGDYQSVFNEIFLIKQTIGAAHLKVILESGAMSSLEDIYNASYISMEAGTDFVKTSTGKQQPAATFEAVYAMTLAIKDYYNATGRKVGLKPAGGISTPEDALIYYNIVKHNLGEEWLNNKLFRIGASRLANNILSELKGEEVKYF